MSMRVLLAKERILKLIQVWDEEQIKPWSLPELLLQLSNDSQTIAEILKQREEKRIEREQAANLAVQKEQEEQAAQSFTPYWNFLMIDDDDDEHTIQYRLYLERSSKAITPDLPTEEPDNSLSMGDEHLSTIPETKSNEVIKSSVENLILIPSEFEGIFDDTCDNSPPLDVFNDHFEIFSDFNNDCTSSNDDSFEDIDYVEASPSEDSLIMGNEELSTIPEKESGEFINSSVKDLVPILSESEDTSGSDSESVLPSCEYLSPINIFEQKPVTFSNPLFNSNDDFTSSDDESLSDEDVPEDNDIECKYSYDSNLDELTFLVTPLFDSNEDECFTPSDDDELLLYRDSSTLSISVVSILGGFTDESPLEENDDLFDLESKENDWKKILYDAPIDDLITEDKVFNPEIHEIIFSPTYGSLPFEDHHYFSFTYVIGTFLPYFTYLMNSPFPLSSGSEDIIFDLGISAFHFSSLKSAAYECPVEDCPDYKDSRARCFVHRSLDLRSLACLYMGIRYPRS
ncbi:hypothetical protein Tco_0855783 [Tanacetum coccineum]